MKIGIADNTALKFTDDIKNHWIKKGHEVKYEIGASEHVSQWADLYYIDWWDNNIHYLYKWHSQNPKAHKPRFAVRAIDWDIWVRGVRSQEMVDFVDHIICIAPHMEEWLRQEKDDATGKPIEWGDKLKLIRPGVNLDKFTLKTKQTDGFQLGIILGDFWPQAKNHMGGLDIFTTLYKRDSRWRLHLRGQHEPGQYWPIMYEHYLDSRGIRNAVTLYGPVEDIDSWYENIDVLLHPGMKEAFLYVAGESLAKGIKVVCNEFYGSLDIWPKHLLYQTHEQAIEMIKGKKEAARFYRNIIKDKYDAKRMFREFDEVLGI